MNPNLTEIAYILDRSGSMQPMQEAGVAAFNNFIRGQLDVPGDANVTLVQFDDAYEVPVAVRPIHEVPELTAADYVPRGSTALLDAIGRTIKEMDRRIGSMPEAQRPGKVILPIFTDGAENASREYSLGHINDLIRLYREQKGWEILFLAANQDAVASACRMGIDQAHAGNVSFSYQGVSSSGSAMSRKVRAMRMKSAGAMDARALEDDVKSMEQITREEERRSE